MRKKCINPGVIFGPFGVILGHFGSFWVILGPYWAILGHLGSYLGHFGSFLGIFGVRILAFRMYASPLQTHNSTRHTMTQIQIQHTQICLIIMSFTMVIHVPIKQYALKLQNQNPNQGRRNQF